MVRISQEARLELEKSEQVALHDRGPLVLFCETGELWLTCEDRAGDIVLHAGEYFEIPAGREAVVSAFRPSRLTIRRCKQAGDLHIRIGGEAHGRLARLLRWRMPALSSLIPVTHLR
jgi:hypothetical protein